MLHTWRGVLLKKEMCKIPHLPITLYRVSTSFTARSVPYLQCLVGPPVLTTSNGFGNGANSSCHCATAILNVAKSTWCKAPTVSTTFLSGGSLGVIQFRRKRGSQIIKIMVRGYHQVKLIELTPRVLYLYCKCILGRKYFYCIRNWNCVLTRCNHQ